ncbi:MAG: DUF1343 domain-containing protein [Gemmatimonadota bacterium]|nr:DUF1343 domain-containing protein [Gemmatimonadota bacterium]
MRPGIEVLLSDSLHLVAGRRVGLVTNHTGVDRAGRSTIDLLYEHPDIELVALYGPEHGIRGEEQAGVAIESGVDSRTGIPVHSIYGETRKPTPEMLEGVDVLLFDIQDIGVRYYTFVWSMTLAMEAAGENGIPFVVLDRPDPIGGTAIQGTVLDPAYATFVGLYPVPMRHGLTPGELARLTVGEFGVEAELHVVPAEGWRRDMPFAETGLPWLAPSPNMPSVESALTYPGSCLFEGTLLSVGRGTPLAFQQVGAPWLDSEELARRLNGRGMDGVRFDPVTFVPESPGDGKFGGEDVHGVRWVPTSDSYDPARAALAVLVETRRMSGDRWEWRVGHFDRLAGTDAVRLGIEAGEDVAELTAGWDEALAAFAALRSPYLIYP